MTINSNVVLYATQKAFYDCVNLATALAANTYSLVTTGATNGSIITDIIFRSADASARLFNIIIAPTGSQATVKYNVLQISVPASSGNNGSTASAKLSALAPELFDIDLAGNRVLTLEGSGSSGTEISIYVQNTTLTAGAINIMTKRRDY